MNYVTDDYGRSVISVGAPGSIERIKCERPKLLARVNSQWDTELYGHGIDYALKEIRDAGISDPSETTTILKASYFALERPGSVTDLVMRCGHETAPDGGNG